MVNGRIRILFALGVLFCACGMEASAQKKPLQPGEVILIGKLSRAMAIGGETTGWTLEMKSEVTLEGQKLNSIEVAGSQEKLAKYADRSVKARGFVKHHHTTERGDWLVLEVSSIHAVSENPKP